MPTTDPTDADLVLLPTAPGQTAQLPSHRELVKLAAESDGRILAVSQAWFWASIAADECIDHRMCQVQEAN
jgi:hypothetical protein